MNLILLLVITETKTFTVQLVIFSKFSIPCQLQIQGLKDLFQRYNLLKRGCQQESFKTD